MLNFTGTVGGCKTVTCSQDILKKTCGEYILYNEKTAIVFFSCFRT